ncbi:hypothetical protein [Microbacterium atlanticum]|uniref:hypothetical protein n=1 Tax=Microbacterium atlanticum TaxID=2782168 RepID=UPI0018875131|nr:hypothetical protein [Microbacterium atlanticum]
MNRDAADEIVQKAGILAVLYYPEIHADDPDYRLANDVSWVLEEAGEFAEGDREMLVDIVSRVIIDPTGNREALTDFVYGLVEDGD